MSDLTYNQNLKREHPDTAGKDLRKILLGHDSIMVRLYLGQASNQREVFQKEKQLSFENLYLNTFWNKSLISFSWETTSEISFVNREIIFATFEMQYNKYWAYTRP